jgi:hypothetical protein
MLAALIAWNVYAATTGGSFATDLASYEVTRSLVESRSVAMSYDVLATDAERGRDGRYYAPVGIGHPLFGVPFYAAAKIATSAGLRVGKPESLTKAAVVFGSTVAAALCVYFGWLLAWRVSSDGPAASVAALALALATPLWVYAKFGFNAPLAAMCLTASAYGLWMGTRASSSRALVWGGVALGYAVLTRHEMFLGAIPAAIWIALESRADRRLLVRRLLLFGVPVAAGVGLWMTYNYIRFGHPLDTGLLRDPNVQLSTPILQGLYGLLLSPGRSLFLYAPVTIAGLVALAALWKTDRPAVIFLLAYPAVFIPFIAKMHHWDGGESYGPRYLVPIIPFLVIPIALWFRDGVSRRARTLAMASIAAGVLVQLPGVIADFSKTQRAYAAATPGYSIALSRYTWEASPLVLNTQAALRGIPENLRYLGGAPRPPIPRSGDERNRDFSQQFAFSLDFWWLYLFYLGVLPAVAALVCPLLFLTAAALRARQLARVSGTVGRTPAPDRGTI